MVVEATIKKTQKQKVRSRTLKFSNFKFVQNLPCILFVLLLVSTVACKRDTETKTNSVVEQTQSSPEAMKGPATDTKRFTKNEINNFRAAPDTTGTKKSIEGSISGREIRDYTVYVKKGQYLKFTLVTKLGTPYFNLMEPGEEYEAIHNGAINDNHYEGISNKSGDYKVRVYLMRSAARRNEVAKYRLEISTE